MNKISVIIPCHNSSSHLPACLKSLLSQTASLEAYVIDDASDEPLRPVTSDPRIRWLRHEKQHGLAATLDEGLGLSGSEFAMTLHPDCALEGVDWVKKALALFDNPGVAGVSGQIIELTQSSDVVSRVYAVLDHPMQPKTGLRETSFIENRCSIYRRSAIGAAFDRSFFISGEDQALCYSIREKGYHFLVDGSLKVMHNRRVHQTSLLDNLRHQSLYGYSAVQIFKRHSSKMIQNIHSNDTDMRARAIHRLLILLTGLLFIAGLLLLPANIPLLLQAVLAARLLYFIILGAYRFADLGPSGFLALPIISFLTDIAYNIGAANGFFHLIIAEKLQHHS